MVNLERTTNKKRVSFWKSRGFPEARYNKTQKCIQANKMVKKKTTKKPATRKKASKTTKKTATRKTTTRKPATRKPRSKARQVYVAIPQTKVAGKTYNKKIDKRLIAKKPGKRISANGKVYYEYRVNRSDINKYY